MSAIAAKPTRIVLRPPVAAPPDVAMPTRQPKSVPSQTVQRPTLVDVKSAGRPASPVAKMSGSAIEPISQFIDLEVEARRCGDIDALRYSIVNSTRKIAHFDQAFLAEPAMSGGWIVTRASSIASVDRNSLVVRSIEGWIRLSGKTGGAGLGEPRLANLAVDAIANDQPTSAINFPNALWLPIKAPDGRIFASLVALKRENWRPQHSALLMPLADTYGHAWNALAPHAVAPAARIRSYISKSRLMIAAGLVALAAAFVPVPMSALAPGEITAAEPILVTAPIDGVISDILAAPGSWIERGAPIIKFVDVKLRNEVEVAKRNKAVAESRHFKVVQSAVSTQKDMQDIATTKAELDVASAELKFSEDMFGRSVVLAERSGLLIYSAKSDWIGKPVAIGERVMEIGDPANTEIKIDIPVSDAVAIQKDGLVSLFLDGDPLNAVEGHIQRMSYRPTLTAEQQLAFRVYAKFNDGKPRRIGLRGVARVNSESVSLWFYLFRRPIAALRQRAGL